MAEERKICVGKITGAHGLRGLVRLRSFTDDPAAIGAYPLIDAQGQSRRLTLKTPMGEEFIAEVEGIADRNAAEAARGQELFVLREQLPELSQREYYLADLIGLRVDDQAGQRRGSVAAVHDFGGGTLLEIQLPEGRTALLPFRDAFVPLVDVNAGFLTIAPPDDWLTVPKKQERAS